MTPSVKVTIWNEFLCELEQGPAREFYPLGIHQAIAAGIAPLADFEIRTACLNQPEHGLSEQLLADTDVLVWWGHRAHDSVQDQIVNRVHRQVLQGMGLVVLHSGHFSKIFQRLMGTHCGLQWAERGEVEKIWNLQPAHPILRGIPQCIQLDQEEMYGEPFGIPQPDELLMVSWFAGGEVFRSLCSWRRGSGQVVYFRPGHETFPSYHHPDVLRVIANSCRYVCRPAP